MMVDLFVTQAHDEIVKPWMDDYNKLVLDYFQGEKFSELLDDGGFDMIILEDTISLLAAVVVAELDIPIMGLICHPKPDINDRYNLPGLINSVPNSLNADVNENSLTFLERGRSLLRMARVFMAALSIFQSLNPHIQSGYFDPDKHFMGIFDVVFVNDHPAYSFPFLSPPNTFYLGTFNLENHDISPLPADYLEFIANCPHEHTIYFSFGSYLQNITQFSGTPAILNTLGQMNVCVIIQSKVDLRLDFDLPTEKFLQRSWIPQRDLLGSGKVDFFMTHCGNNGRLEAIFYNVPLLCVPLFADQYLNGRLVERNKFGLLVPWEDVSEKTLRITADNMLKENEIYVSNMKTAVEIAQNDPGSGSEVLKFYTDVLVKNKNADYLVNRLILKQSVVQIYNLDIAGIALIALIGVIAGILFCMGKCFRFANRVFCKVKTD